MTLTGAGPVIYPEFRKRLPLTTIDPNPVIFPEFRERLPLTTIDPSPAMFPEVSERPLTMTDPSAVTVPLFTGGRLRGNLKLAEARFQESLSIYQQTVQGAFREVSDGLIAYQRTQEFRAKQQERTQAHRDATDMANVRYDGGVTSYLEVLYNEQELFNAELSLAQARRNELLSVVQLYRSLGGGWQPPVPQAQAKAGSP